MAVSGMNDLLRIIVGGGAAVNGLADEDGPILGEDGDEDEDEDEDVGGGDPDNGNNNSKEPGGSEEVEEEESGEEDSARSEEVRPDFVLFVDFMCMPVVWQVLQLALLVALIMLLPILLSCQGASIHIYSEHQAKGPFCVLRRLVL